MLIFTQPGDNRQHENQPQGATFTKVLPKWAPIVADSIPISCCSSFFLVISFPLVILVKVPPVFIEFRVNQAIPPSFSHGFSHGFTMVFPSPLSRTTPGAHHRKPPVRARTPHCFFSTSFGRPNSLKSTGLGRKLRPVDMVISPR